MIFTYPVNCIKKAVVLTLVFPEKCKLQRDKNERMFLIPGVAVVKILALGARQDT